MSYLSVKNIRKNFGACAALSGVSFSLEKGEVLSIIGSSGSGKTTLLRCINFLETPDEGEMILDGETLLNIPSDVKETEETLRLKRLNFGLVFQSFNLFPQYSVMGNITLAPMLMLKSDLKKRARELKSTGMSAACIKNELKTYEAEESERIYNTALDLLAKTGLADKKDNYPHELSGGQKQRVAIARALAMRPQILCFDEPTSALDPELTGEVLKVINELKTSSGITMIIVTHEMEFARQISDKVIFMSDGVIVEEGKSDKIFTSPETIALKNFLQGYKKDEF